MAGNFKCLYIKFFDGQNLQKYYHLLQWRELYGIIYVIYVIIYVIVYNLFDGEKVLSKNIKNCLYK